MGKKLEYTTNSVIRAALRRLFMRSRERAKTLREGKYTCRACNIKQSVAKGREVAVRVHHRSGIKWDGIFKAIAESGLLNQSDMEVLCADCHKEEHAK